MSDSQVIARKFRPQTFEQVIGQEAITRTLSNSIAANRVHQAYLFAGARGVGKTTTARIFAKALNCASGVTTSPCGACDSCREIAASRSIDVLEIDAASNTGVDNVRDVIINTVSIAPARDRNKIFIIDEVHQLSPSAFNALLKTLEEPPPRVVFIMATTEMHKVPETILSRCQIFEFRTITAKKIVEQLRQIAVDLGLTISETALFAIARAGEGSMRDAESALDQVISFAGATVTDEDVSAALGLVDTETLNATLGAVAEQNGQELLRICDAVVARGYDLRTFCRELMAHIRALLVVKISGFEVETVQLPASEAEALTALADSFSEQDLIRFFSIIAKTEQDIRVSSQPRFQLEIALMKLAQAQRLYLLEEALQRLVELESRLASSTISSDAIAPRATGPAAPAGRPSGSVGVSPVQTRQGRAGALPADAPQSGPKRPNRTETPGSAAARSEIKGAAAPGRPNAAPSARSVDNPQSDQGRIPASNPPPEPPPYLDEPYDLDPAPPPQNLASEPTANGQEAVAKIKEIVESRRKMMIFSALNSAESIVLDGSFLRVAYPPSGALFKGQIESRDNRQFIEEVCAEVLKRRVALSVTIGAQPKTEETESAAGPSRAKEPRLKAEDHPAIRSIVNKFHGEVIEIIRPED